MSVESSDPGHGNSPAAWTAVIIMLLAVFIGTFAFYFVAVWLVWACAALFLVGLIAGWVMKMAGYGVGGSRVAVKEH